MHLKSYRRPSVRLLRLAAAMQAPLDPHRLPEPVLLVAEAKPDRPLLDLAQQVERTHSKN